MWRFLGRKNGLKNSKEKSYTPPSPVTHETSKKKQPPGKNAAGEAGS